MTAPNDRNDTLKYRVVNDLESSSDPAEGSAQETPSGPFAPPPMPDVLKAREGNEPRRAVIVKPVNTVHLGRVFAVGMDFAYAFIGATALGWVADWLLKSSPRGVIAGACVGLVVGMYRFVTEARRLLRSPGGPDRG